MSTSVENNITKPSIDTRSYRGLTLSNGLDALLISDPESEQSAASLDVGVGHFSDPANIPGLAHFLEHMLFLGTEKYPDEESYTTYLSNNGGSSNAYTSMQNTNYHFSVLSDALPEALDRFAQFFISPLFDESCTMREMNAVHNEHNKNLQSDNWRKTQLERTEASKNHPYSKFGTGDLSTLNDKPKEMGLNIRDELIKFHKTYYSANIMKLVVFGRASLDELQDMIVDCFSPIVNNNVQRPTFPDQMPYEDEQLAQQYYVVPVKDQKTLSLSWQIPATSPNWKSKPNRYISHLLGHEGPGSLLSLFKTNGWANSLSAGSGWSATDFAFFKVTVDLTDSGIANIDSMVDLVFQYLQLIRNQGPQEWVWKEQMELAQMDFKFKDSVRPARYVEQVSSWLHDYPISEVLAAPYLLYEYHPEDITNLLDMMTPEKSRLYVYSKIFEGTTDKQEKWYKTDYMVSPIQKEQLDLWASHSQGETTLDPALALPEENPFIPTEFPVLSKAVPQSDAAVPTLIKDSPILKLWHKVDDTFETPKGTVGLQVISPSGYTSPLASLCTELITRLVKDSLVEFSYDAELAGLYYTTQKTMLGFEIMVTGYTHKLPVLLEKVVDKFVNLEFDQDQFDRVHDLLKREYGNFKKTQPYSLALYNINVLLEMRRWTIDEYLEVIDSVTMDQVQAFLPSLFDRIKLEALVHGAISKDAALEMMENLFANQLNASKPITKSQMPCQRIVQLPKGTTQYYQVPHTNPADPNSAIETIYQIGFNDLQQKCLLDLVEGLAGKEVFQQLRTVEQLGYIVFSGGRTDNSVYSFRVIVQSSDSNPLYLQARSESFLRTFATYLSDLSDDEFNTVKSSLIAKKLEKFKNLSEESRMYWGRIIEKKYDFDVFKQQAAMLEDLSRQDVVEFFVDITDAKSENRRVLSSQVFNRDSTQLIKTEDMQGEEYLDAVQQILEQLDQVVDQKRKTQFEEIQAQLNQAKETNETKEEAKKEATKEPEEVKEEVEVDIEAYQSLLPSKIDQGVTFITDPVEFKASSSMYPGTAF